VKLKVGDDVYEYDSQALTVREAAQIKIQAGLGMLEFTQGNPFEDARILQALIWLCRLRDGELKLRIDEVDIPIRDVDIIPDEAPEDEAPTVATLPEHGSESPTTSTEPTGSSPNGATTSPRSLKSGTSRRGIKNA